MRARLLIAIAYFISSCMHAHTTKYCVLKPIFIFSPAPPSAVRLVAPGRGTQRSCRFILTQCKKAEDPRTASPKTAGRESSGMSATLDPYLDKLSTHAHHTEHSSGLSLHADWLEAALVREGVRSRARLKTKDVSH